jgi:hypothetical protein
MAAFNLDPKDFRRSGHRPAFAFPFFRPYERRRVTYIVACPDGGPAVSNSNAPQLNIPLDLAESLVKRLLEAAKATGQDSLLKAAASLQAAIDAQFSKTPPEH